MRGRRRASLRRCSESGGSRLRLGSPARATRSPRRCRRDVRRHRHRRHRGESGKRSPCRGGEARPNRPRPRGRVHLGESRLGSLRGSRARSGGFVDAAGEARTDRGCLRPVVGGAWYPTPARGRALRGSGSWPPLGRDAASDATAPRVRAVARAPRPRRAVPPRWPERRHRRPRAGARRRRGRVREHPRSS